MELDRWAPRLAAGQSLTVAPEPRGGRSELLRKVFVTPETKAILSQIGERDDAGGPAGVAALLVEELRNQGQIEHVWKASKNRWRRARYAARHGARHVGGGK